MNIRPAPSNWAWRTRSISVQVWRRPDSTGIARDPHIAVRIRGPGRRGPLRCQPGPRATQIRPHAHGSATSSARPGSSRRGLSIGWSGARILCERRSVERNRRRFHCERSWRAKASRCRSRDSEGLAWVGCGGHLRGWHEAKRRSFLTSCLSPSPRPGAEAPWRDSSANSQCSHHRARRAWN